MDDYLNIRRRTAKPPRCSRTASFCNRNGRKLPRCSGDGRERKQYMWLSDNYPVKTVRHFIWCPEHTARFVSDGAPRLIALRLKKYGIAVISRKRVETHARLHLQNFSEHDANVDCSQPRTIPGYRSWTTSKFYVISEHNSCNNQMRLQDVAGMSSGRLLYLSWDLTTCNLSTPQDVHRSVTGQPLGHFVCEFGKLELYKKEWWTP